METPTKYLNGNRCIKCIEFELNIKNIYKIIHNTIEYIYKCNIKHNNRYTYKNTIFINSHDNVIITCKEHGNFEQIARQHLNKGSNCSICSHKKTADGQRMSIQDFILIANNIHGFIYDYSEFNYTTARNKGTIICKNIKHGRFDQSPDAHLRGVGCPKCGHNCKITSKEEFLIEAQKIHGDIYDYSEVIFKSANIKCIIICKTHDYFEQSPTNHLKGSGCNKCNCSRQYSKAAILYLNFMEKMYNIEIQHAENKGEYKIDTTRYKADGYCEETNTIYEFHGTIYHGDPRCCNSLEYNYLGKNYGELYQKTKEREQLIIDLGYNLVVMWEYDWNKLNKSIRIIQQKFKQHH